MRKILKNESVQAFVASVICILAGLLIGYIVLLFINPAGAGESIVNVIKNFFQPDETAGKYAGQDHAADPVLPQHPLRV